MVADFRKIGSGELILSTMKSFLSENEKDCSFTGITPMHVGLWPNRKIPIVHTAPPQSALKKFG